MWQLVKMPDHGLAMLKVLSRLDGDQVAVIVRSNAIALYRLQDGICSLRPKDRLMLIAARDLSLERLANIFSARDAAEVVAVFRFNRRELFHVVHPREGKP